MSLDDRKLEVLRAIVEDYVATQEPVGSKALVDRHHLDVSPATIRNDMAVLEEEGYIAQPHTSAGRIPTDKGYRLFVDRLTTVKPLSPAERRAIQTFLDGAVDLDDVVTRTVRLLAQLTRQVAVVQYPSLMRSTVRHVELVPLSTTRVLLVVITDAGRVEQRVVELPDEADDSLVGDLRARLGYAVAGLDMSAVATVVESLPESFSPEDRQVVAAVAATLIEALVDKHDERLAVAGHRQPGAVRAGLRDRPRVAAGGARRTRRPAPAAGGGDRARPHSRSGSATRTPSPACRPPRSSPPDTARGNGHWPAWASSVPPGWTTQEQSPRLEPLRDTSARSWLGTTRGTWTAWCLQPTTTRCLASRAMRRPTTSRRRIAGLRDSSTPTSIRIRRRKSGSRK